jgi:hypothetical protein
VLWYFFFFLQKSSWKAGSGSEGIGRMEKGDRRPETGIGNY